MNALYILLEGPDDRRFVETLITPLLNGKYDWVQVIEWSQMTDQKRQRLVASFRNMGAAYFCLTDKDDFPCITTAKEKLSTDWPSLQTDRIIIVVKAIESWFLAGLNDSNRKKLKIKFPKDVTKVGHHEFTRSMPSRFDSEVDYQVEILRHYDLTAARRNSPSFAYFYNHLAI